MSDAAGIAPIKSCCVSGHLHEGTPEGSQQTLHGLPTYVIEPKNGAGAKTGTTVVFLTDIFGFKLTNTRLLADEWSAKGYRVLIPDILSDDPISNDLLNVITPNLREQERKSAVEKAADSVKIGATFGPWALNHRDAVTIPIIRDFLEAVRAEPQVIKIVAVGFCFGGRHAILAASGEAPLSDAAVALHPSRLSLPAELENVTRPVFIGVGNKDAMMSVDQTKEASKILAGLREKHVDRSFQVKLYPNAVHGFSVQGDMTDPEERKLKESVNEDALAFVASAL